jgi:hypothetical protein
MAKNIRRTGVAVTIKGKVNPEYVRSVFDGPTAERLAKAQSHYTVGDDKQGTRIYHFHDTTIDRLYSRLARQAKGRESESGVRAEYLALQKYRIHWHRGGLEISLGICAARQLNGLFHFQTSGLFHSAGPFNHIAFDRFVSKRCAPRSIRKVRS